MSLRRGHLLFAFDLGTTYIKASMPNHPERGIVMEPSCVAVEKPNEHQTSGKRMISAIGTAAKNLWERNNNRTDIYWPISDGRIENPEWVSPLIHHLAAELMLKQKHWLGGAKKVFDSPFDYLLDEEKREKKRRSELFQRQEIMVVLGVPPECHSIYLGAVKSAVTDAFPESAVEVHLVSRTMAASLGAGVSVESKIGNVVLVLGGGNADLTVVSEYGEVATVIKPYGGNAFDKAIQRGMKKNHGVEISQFQAEEWKIQYGQAISPNGDARPIEYKGLLSEGSKEVKFSSEEIFQFINPEIANISEMVSSSLSKKLKDRPRLRESVAENGLVVVGGPAKMSRLEERFQKDLNLKVEVVENPQEVPLKGLEVIALNPQIREKVVYHTGL